MHNNLLSPVTHEGIWWAPDNPDDQVGGTLSYDPSDGCKLSLIGFLGEASAFAAGKGNDLEIIHGQIKGGGAVTLYDNLEINFQTSSPGITTQKFFSHFAFLGAHIESIDDFAVRQCDFRLTNLEEWLGRHPFDLQGLGGDSEPVELGISTPEKEKISLPTIRSSLTTGTSFKARGDAVREYNIEVLSWLTLEPEEAETIQSYWETIGKIQHLVALCLGERVYRADIDFRTGQKLKGSEKSVNGKIICLGQQNPNPTSIDRRPHPRCLTINDFADKEKVIGACLLVFV